MKVLVLVLLVVLTANSQDDLMPPDVPIISYGCDIKGSGKEWKAYAWANYYKTNENGIRVVEMWRVLWGIREKLRKAQNDCADFIEKLAKRERKRQQPYSLTDKVRVS